MLLNNGRQIDAVNLAFEFELTEQFSPVSLLKSYLIEAKKVSSPVKSGNTSPSAQVCSLLFNWLKGQHLLILYNMKSQLVSYKMDTNLLMVAA